MFLCFLLCYQFLCANFFFASSLFVSSIGRKDGGNRYGSHLKKKKKKEGKLCSTENFLAFCAILFTYFVPSLMFLTTARIFRDILIRK